MTDPRISAVICTFGRETLLASAIASLARQTLPCTDYEIVVVDNASRDGTPALLATMSAKIANLRPIDEPVLGVARARNTGARAARAPLIAYLDDDAQADAGWLEAALAAFAEAPEVGCIGGPVRPRWPESRPRWLSAPLLSYLAIVDLGATRRPLAAGEWLAGTNAVFRKTALAAVGGFCEALGRRGRSLLSGEDVEIVASLMAAGWPVVYDPDLVIHHTIPLERLTVRWFARRAFWQGISEAVARRDLAGDGLPPHAVPRQDAEGLSAVRLVCAASRRLGRVVGRGRGPNRERSDDHGDAAR